MTVIESAADFIHYLLGFALKHLSPRLLIDVVLKRSTLYELHEEYYASVRELEHVAQFDHAWVLQGLQDLGLLKSL